MVDVPSNRLAARRGPPTSLTPELLEALSVHLRRGRTRRHAAALERIPEARLQSWLSRGRTELAEQEREENADRELSLNAELVLAVDFAEAKYQGKLLKRLDVAMLDKSFNERAIRWRLAVGAPKDFTIPRTEGQGSTGPGAFGPAFELVSPEQAMATLEEKLTRFLTGESLRAEVQAALEEQTRTDAEASHE